MQLEPLFLKYLSKKEGGIAARSAAAVLEMHAEGATVPFMARYRKDKTGQLDENQIRAVIQYFEEFEEIKKRKTFILKEVGEQGNLSSGLQNRIELCWDVGELEEIYRPYKKKKKTKATIAKEAGLGHFADWLWQLAQGKIESEISIEVKAKDFLNVALGFASYELVIGGAKDILIEQIANEASLRELVLRNFTEKGRLASERAKDFKPNSKYEMYAKHEEPVRALMETRSSHRYLAMRRAWQEGELSLKVLGDEELLLRRFEEFATQKPESPAGEILKLCAKSALNLYVIPSVTNDVHRKLKEKADQDAVRVFSENLRKLLLASPFGPQVVLGVDPGLKSGCKMALVDKAGTYLTHTVFQILGDRA
ncbi:MAG: Tex-like N-terminal domain-containing protein, partial [Bdellovibrio sp.]